MTYPANDARKVTTEVDLPWSAGTCPLGFDVEFVFDPACTAMHHTVEEGFADPFKSSSVFVYGDSFQGTIKLETFSDWSSCIISAPSMGA